MEKICMQNKGIRKIRENSTTQRLIKNLGIEEVEKAWIKRGMNAWEELSKRMNEKSPIYRGVVINKTIPAAYYKHLIFEEDDKNAHNTLS
jgi:hypothetical protein